MVEQYRQQIDSMMQRELSRGEFLKFMGIALLACIGVISFFKNMREVMPAHSSRNNHSAPGYGRSAYGR